MAHTCLDPEYSHITMRNHLPQTCLHMFRQCKQDAISHKSSSSHISSCKLIDRLPFWLLCPMPVLSQCSSFGSNLVGKLLSLFLLWSQMYNVHILCFIILVSVLPFAVLRQREVGWKCMPFYVLSNSISVSHAVKFEEVIVSFLIHMLADKCSPVGMICVHILNSQ